MRYVGNMRRTAAADFNNSGDKAVFPPGSVVPEQMSDNAVMYSPNRMNRQQQNGFREGSRELERNVENVVDSVINAVTAMEDTGDFRTENQGGTGESMHGLMDYDGLEFPLPAGQVLKRKEIPPMSCVGSVQDPSGFSPANGLAGRPMESMPDNMMSGQQTAGMNEQGGSMAGRAGNRNMNMNMNSMNMNSMNSMQGGAMSQNQSMQGGGMMGRPAGGGMGMQGSMVCGPSIRLGDVICMYAGKNIEIEFLFGADTYVKKSGILSGAGLNFIVLTDPQTMQKTICDLTDMKFISISHQ